MNKNQILLKNRKKEIESEEDAVFERVKELKKTGMHFKEESARREAFIRDSSQKDSKERVMDIKRTRRKFILLRNKT